MRGISWLAANQLASQEGLCTKEQVSIIIIISWQKESHQIKHGWMATKLGHYAHKQGTWNVGLELTSRCNCINAYNICKLVVASRLYSHRSTLQTRTVLTTNKTCDIFTLPHVWWEMPHDRRLIDTTRFCDQIIPYNYPPSCSLSTLFDIPSAPPTSADKHVTRWPPYLCTLRTR